MKKTINYDKITNELISEIKESFHAFKSDRDYLDKIQVLTAEKGSNGKRTWINLFTKEKGKYHLNDENINLMIRNKKLPGETEEEFKNKILNSIRITYTGLEYNDKGLPSKKNKTIKGKEWEEIRNAQIKIEDKEERRPIGAISGTIKHIKKRISITKSDLEAERAKWAHKNIITSLDDGFTSRLNGDFDKLFDFVKKVIINMTDTEFDNFFKGRGDNFYNSIFSSNEEMMHSSYIDLVKDLIEKNPIGKKYKNMIKESDPLYKYLNNKKLLEDLVNDYLNKSRSIKETPIKLYD